MGAILQVVAHWVPFWKKPLKANLRNLPTSVSNIKSASYSLYSCNYQKVIFKFTNKSTAAKILSMSLTANCRLWWWWNGAVKDMDSYHYNKTRHGKLAGKKNVFSAAPTVLPTILFINMKYCRSLAPKRVSDPKPPQREEMRDRERERERGVKKNRRNWTKLKLKYRERR